MARKAKQPQVCVAKGSPMQLLKTGTIYITKKKRCGQLVRYDFDKFGNPSAVISTGVGNYRVAKFNIIKKRR